MGLVEDARAWKDAKEAQAQEALDRLRSTGREAAPMVERAAELHSPGVVAPAIEAGGILKQGMTPTTPTAEDKLTGTPPPPPPPPLGVPAQPQQNSVMMPTMGGGGGGSSRSGVSVTQGAQIAPETRELLDQSEQEQVSALKHGEQATEQANAADAEQAGRTATYMEKQRLMSEMDPVALHKQHAIAEARQNVADLQNERVDTQHFQKSQNLGQKLAWAVGMAFGGFASGMRGGPNTAAQLYSQAIQDDINAQRDNIGHKTDVQKGLLGDLQADFKDYKQQDAAAQIVGMNVFVKKLEAERATTKNATAKANLDMEIAHAKDIMAQRHVQLDEATSNKVTKNFETVSGGGAGSGGITPQALAEKRIEATKMLQATGKPFTAQDVENTVASWYRGGGTLPNMTKGPAGGGIDTSGLRTKGDAAAGVKAADVLTSALPAWLAPKGNSEMQKIQDYSSTVVGTLKSLEPRMTDEQIAVQARPYTVNPSDPPELAKQKVDAFIARVEASNAAKKASNVDVSGQ